MTYDFRWQDGERLILFGRGQASGGEAMSILGSGYVLLTTPRAGASAPAQLAGAAGSVEYVGSGRVDELAAELRSRIESELIVALGGGRIVDVAKALAAADPPRRVAAIPTTLSGAEMTPIHRHATGVPLETPRVRPQIVINDPALSASQPLPELAQSAANALGHAVEGPLTPLRNPVADLAARRAAELIERAFAPGGLVGTPGADEASARDGLALGALLAGYVISSTGYGLHHVMSQTLVRFAGLGHGEANTIMLPHTVAALRRRSPSEIERFAEALGTEPVAFARRLGEVAQSVRLRDTGIEHSVLQTCVEQAAQRAELAMTPPAADQAELAALYDAAW